MTGIPEPVPVVIRFLVTIHGVVVTERRVEIYAEEISTVITGAHAIPRPSPGDCITLTLPLTLTGEGELQ